MILSKLNLSESTELEFSIDVYGTPEKTSSVRFVIEGKGFDISIPCMVKDENVKVTIPKLKGIMESGEYPCRLECIIDNKIFTPLNESVEFEPLVEFEVKKTKAETVKEGVKVQMKTPVGEDMKEKKPSLEEALRNVMSEGYDVSNIEGKLVIKKNNDYFGVITKEATTVLTTKPHQTLKSMLEEVNAIQ